MLDRTQRDFEMAVIHAKHMIEKEQAHSQIKFDEPTFQTDLTTMESVILNDKGSSPLANHKEQQKREILSYLQSKLRMIKLLKLKTFPKKRDIVSEAVDVLAEA